MNSDLRAALTDIESRDPDGGNAIPTSTDYDAHAAWAIRTYGQDVWNTYRKGGWEEQGLQW